MSAGVRNLLLGTALLSAAPSAAATVLFEDFFFEGWRQQGSLPNYTGFAQFDVLGAVDLERPSNPFGLVSLRPHVDMAGRHPTAGLVTSSTLTSRDAFAYRPGQLLTLTIAVGGSDVFDEGDRIYGTLEADQPTNWLDVTAGGAFDPWYSPIYTYLPSVSGSAAVRAGSPVALYSISAVTTDYGKVRVAIGAWGTDDWGPRLFGVTLEISDIRYPVKGMRTFAQVDAVPEPASWMLLIAGFGLAGAAIRRQSSDRASARQG